jgi:hypothetical protein
METLVQADAWVLASYRRMDALDVPAFHPSSIVLRNQPVRATRDLPLHCLGTRWPLTRQSFSSFLQAFPAAPLPADEGLNLVLRFLASPLRFEPLNSFALHRAVASTRSMFPIQFVLITRARTGDKEAMLYFYHPDHHALEGRSPAAAVPSLPEGCDWAVVGIGRLWIVAGKYAEYAPYVVTLEAGMLQAELEHLARLANWQTEMLSLEGPQWRMALGLGALEAALVGLAGKGPCPWEHLPETQSRAIAEWQCEPGLAERYPKLLPLANLFDPPESIVPLPRMGQAAGLTGSDVARQPIPALGIAGEKDLLSILGARTSGNDAVGFSPIARTTDAETFTTLMWVWQTLSEGRARLSGEEALVVSVAWLSPQNAPVGLYSVQLAPLFGQADGDAFVRSLEASLPHELYRYNMASLSYMFVISADIPGVALQHQEYTLRRLHLAAGAIAQDISIALSAFGMFARPVRMLKEMDLANAWRMKTHILYQVLAGYNRSANLGIELL